MNAAMNKAPIASKNGTYDTKNILTVSGVTKFYGGVKALDNLSFTIGQGEVVGLLGPNGSGKTTLIKIINGLMDMYDGDVRICGHKPGIKSKSLVSYLPDVDFLRGDQKITDAINMYGDFFYDFDVSKAKEMLTVIGLDASRRIKTLSKGMKEKLQLVLVMSRKAQLYIFDEPIAGVDPAARDFIIDTIIRNYNENGAILISTHLIGDIESMLERAVFLKNGEKILDGEAENLRAQNGKSIDALFREVFKC